MHIDIFDLLKSYGIENIKHRHHYIQCNCPFHDDKSPSAAFYLDKNLFICFTCRTTVDVYGFIALMENIPVSEVKTKYSGELSKKMLINNIKKKIKEFNIENVNEKIKYYDDSILNNFTSDYSYMVNRGFNEEILKDFEVGYYPGRKMVSLPVRDTTNKLVGVYGRVTYDNKAKYMPIVPVRGFPKSKVLYGLNKVEGDTLILVEGNLDVIKAFQEGFRYAAAIQGCFISKVHESLISKRFNKLILALDNDDAGKIAGLDIHNRMKKKIKVLFFNYGNSGKKDIGDMNKEEIEYGIKNSTMKGSL